MYKYDAESKLIRSYVYDSVTMENLSGVQVSYDLQSRVSQVLTSFDYTVSSGVSNEAMMYLYSYDNTTGDLTRYNVSGLNSGVSVTVNPTYDRFGRTTNKNILGEISDVDVFYNQLTYDYKTNGTNESGLISQIISKVGQSSTGTLTTTTYNYTYDDNGNITQITDSSGVVQNKYTYDDLGQLTREDNRALNKSYVWTYDNAGNILSKKTYAFTTGTLGTATSTVNYTYGNSNWGDQLTNFNGAAITYDAIGNPISMGGYTYEWEGRTLLSRYDDYKFANYTYNSKGLRISKEYGEYDYNGYRHEYTLNGSQIVREVVYYDDDGSGTYVESYMLVYIYDENGSPIGMKYRTPSMAKDVYECFFFEKNLQGDIVSVYNSAGVKVIAYTYDAWGNFIQTHTGGGASDVSIATKNPFRYRGYYYDTNTGFYYLQSRYYNPQWGRFLNADGYISTGAGLLGYNMYSYCNNNPIMYVDPEGDLLVLFFVIVLYICVSESNYDHNKELDEQSSTSTENQIVTQQGQEPISEYRYGLYSASWNSCETIAVHNAKVLKGMDSSLSQTMKDFQKLGAMFGLGFFGSNPCAIDRVLNYYGIQYTRVGIDELTQPGLYIISYWNDGNVFKGLHTIAIKYDGTTYMAYNYGAGTSTKNPYDYAADGYICGYYFG